MPYRQDEEPLFFCPDCGKECSLNDSRVQFGLFSEGKLLKCSVCFGKFKHEFWLRQVGEA